MRVQQDEQTEKQMPLMQARTAEQITSFTSVARFALMSHTNLVPHQHFVSHLALKRYRLKAVISCHMTASIIMRIYCVFKNAKTALEHKIINCDNPNTTKHSGDLKAQSMIVNKTLDIADGFF